MRCYYCCTRRERSARLRTEDDAVAICQRCGAAICLDHLCEVRRERRNAGLMVQPAGQNIEFLCVACAGPMLSPTRGRRGERRLGEKSASARRTGGADSASVGRSDVSVAQRAAGRDVTHGIEADGEALWSDPAAMVVAAEAFLAHRRSPSADHKGTDTPTAWWRRGVGRVARWFRA